MNVKEVLQAARDRLAERGAWTKGTFQTTDKTKCCALGAVALTVTDGKRSQLEYSGAGPEYELYREARKALRDCIPEEGNDATDVISYNDRSRTRKSDILALFDCAIDRA